MFDLTGKVALVAGGAGYLGAPICQKLSEQGAAVIVADIDLERTKAKVESISAAVPEARVKGLFLDISDEKSIKTLTAQIIKEFGGLHILVNTTCSAVGKSVEEINTEEFDSTLHTNLTGSFNLARESADVMTQGGSIIFFSSMYGRVSPDPRIYSLPMKPNPIEYGVAKAGLEQMVRYLAVYWAPRNIRVNAVCPGPFSNPDLKEYAENPEFKDFLKRLAEKVPLGRIGRKEETAGPVIFLASDEASYVTGQILVVDGGWTIW
ncbi:MAG: SDR family oxidoreductase [Candidatus Omnitrophota bacterium]